MLGSVGSAQLVVMAGVAAYNVRRNLRDFSERVYLKQGNFCQEARTSTCSARFTGIALVAALHIYTAREEPENSRARVPELCVNKVLTCVERTA